MKKHDEGYVLPLVLVVMIVMCLIATSLMSFSLQNLKSQQASIERMADKYVAEGAIEVAVAKLIDCELSDATETVQKAINQTGCEIIECKISDDHASFTATVKHDNISVSCVLNLIEEDGIIKAVTYERYDITNTGGNAE